MKIILTCRKQKGMESKFDAGRQSELAGKFHVLHHSENTLVLLNAWDCVSAKIVEAAGFPAIATTSSGISWSCGYQDGEHIPLGIMIETVRRITRVVNIPVTVDIEGGYASGDVNKFSDFIEKMIDAGVVGINLEDSNSRTHSLNDIEQQKKLISAAKEAGKQKGINLFVNARTDAMHSEDDLKIKIQICIERAKAFEEAGADGIFVPFVRNIETVAALKKAIHLPLNILLEDSLDIATLKQLKVNRISTGSKPILATLSLLKKIASELQTGDEWASLFTKETNYGEMNKLFE